MITKLFNFMIHSGTPFYESVGMFLLLIVLCIAFVIYSFNASKQHRGLVVSSLFLIMVASVAFVWGSMILMGNSWKNVYDALFKFWAPFATLIGMYLCGFSMVVITLGYNYMMKSSKKVMSLRPRDRHDFLGTNSSWLLLRLATYHLLVASGIAGMTLSEAYFPVEAADPSLTDKIWSAVIMIGPFIVGLLVCVKVITKLNLVSYSWKIPDTPDYKVDN